MQQFDDAASITLAIVIVVTVGFVQEYRYTVVFVHLISYCSLQLDSSRNTGTQSSLSISFVIVPYSWILPGIQIYSRRRPSHLFLFLTVGFFQEYRYTVVFVHLISYCSLQLDSSRNTGTRSSSFISFVIVRYSWIRPGIQVHGRLRPSHLSLFVTVGFVQEYRYTVVFVHLFCYCSLQLDSSRNTGTRSSSFISFVIVPFSWILPGIQGYSRLRSYHSSLFVTVGFVQEYRYTVVFVHLICYCSKHLSNIVLIEYVLKEGRG